MDRSESLIHTDFLLKTRFWATYDKIKVGLLRSTSESSNSHRRQEDDMKTLLKYWASVQSSGSRRSVVV